MDQEEKNGIALILQNLSADDRADLDALVAEHAPKPAAPEVSGWDRGKEKAIRRFGSAEQKAALPPLPKPPSAQKAVPHTAVDGRAVAAKRFGSAGGYLSASTPNGDK